MYVDHFAQKFRHKGLRENSHKASQHQHVGAIGVDGIGQRTIKTVSRFVAFVVDRFSLYTGCARGAETFGIGTIANNGGYCAIQ